MLSPFLLNHPVYTTYSNVQQRTCLEWYSAEAASVSSNNVSLLALCFTCKFILLRCYSNPSNKTSKTHQIFEDNKICITPSTRFSQRGHSKDASVCKHKTLRGCSLKPAGAYCSGWSVLRWWQDCWVSAKCCMCICWCHELSTHSQQQLHVTH
jgi:hypothetical protein